jgi:ABC-type bacteriocin/lantibiotic exporter with double-glycine peptidase domain
VTNAPLVDRFPRLAVLRAASRRGRVPFVQQLTETECGVACLAMVLGHLGRPTTRDEIRHVLGVGRDGTSAAALLKTARHFGLRARGVRVDLDALAFLRPGSILHWGFDHFVVLERVRRRSIDVLDPAVGPMSVSLEDVGRSFTGVALVFERSETFASKAGPAGRNAWFRALVARAGEWPRILTLSVLLQGVAFAVPIFTGVVVDRVVPRADGHLLSIAAVGLAGVVGVQFVAALIRAHLLVAVRTALDAEITLGLLERLTELPYAFFQQRSTGDVLMRMNANTMIREILTSGVLTGLLDGVMMLLSLSLLFAMSPKMGLAALALSGVQVTVVLMGRARQRERTAAQLMRQARCQGYQVEMLAGMETLKALGCEKHAAERYTDLFVDALNAQLAVARRTAMLDALGSTLRLGAPLALLAIGAFEVLSGHDTLGSMLAECSFAAGVFGPLANMTTLAGQLEMLGSYVDRIEDVHLAEPEQDRASARAAASLAGGVRLDGVSFRYAAQDPFVVRDVTVEAKPGELLAVVGASGSGKSTLAGLLVGLHRPTHGRILYDGVDARDLELRSLRRQLGIVSQRTHLFSGSIRSNIALGDPAMALDDVVAAARAACIHDDIAAMPLGYETPLLDGGSSLSGGQRQRIALARALARRPAVLLLDEATSALDAITERRVQANLASLSCTRVVIAHRLSTIADADRIVVMDGGRLVEQGSHAELVARDGGHYRALVANQVGYAGL